MSESIDTLFAEAMHLSAEQRLTLAHRMLSSVEPAATPEIEVAWNDEIRRRIARYDAGEVKAIPVADVFAELDRRLRQ